MKLNIVNIFSFFLLSLFVSLPLVNAQLQFDNFSFYSIDCQYLGKFERIPKNHELGD